MSCNRLYGGQRKSKQASQRKRSGGNLDGEVKDDGKNPDGEIPDGETTDDSSTVEGVVGGIEGVVKKVVKPAAVAAPTEENQVEPASTENKTGASDAHTGSTGAIVPAAPTGSTKPPAQKPNSFFGFDIGNFNLFGNGNKGGKRRTQRKQQKQRRTQKAGSQKTVIGRIYSKTCVHCVAMEGAWKQLHKMIKQRGGNIVMKDMEAGKMGQQLPQMNKQFLGGSDQRVELQGGFPTLFKIKNSKVEYYGGERTADAMFNWALQ